MTYLPWKLEGFESKGAGDTDRTNTTSFTKVEGGGEGAERHRQDECKGDLCKIHSNFMNLRTQMRDRSK